SCQVIPILMAHIARAARFSFVSISPVLFRFGGPTCLFRSCSMSMSSRSRASERTVCAQK
ncbi:Hypothetical predicted protein, partial [Scomber scombrus]